MRIVCLNIWIWKNSAGFFGKEGSVHCSTLTVQLLPVLDDVYFNRNLENQVYVKTKEGNDDSFTTYHTCTVGITSSRPLTYCKHE